MTKGFGILGAGMIAPLHGQALGNSPKADLVAVADLDMERAEKLAAEYGADAKAYGGLEEMLADPRVEVVNIVTPNHLHAEACAAVAAAGKHVMCEKPPAMSLADTDRMIAACRDAGVVLGIYVQCRVREPVRQIRAALDAGRFGTVLRADAVMKWFRPADYYHMDAWRSQRKSGAGVTIQHAFHYIDLLQFLMGPAKRVRASMRNLAHRDVELEDTLDGLIEFENGAMGSVAASTGLWPGTDVRIEIYGTDGAAIMEGAAFTLWQFRDERPEDADIVMVGDASRRTGGSSATGLDSDEHQFVIDDACDAVDEGREPVIPASAVRPTLEMALGMYASDARGDWVDLPLDDEESVWG